MTLSLYFGKLGFRAASTELIATNMLRRTCNSDDICLCLAFRNQQYYTNLNVSGQTRNNWHKRTDLIQSTERNGICRRIILIYSTDRNGTLRQHDQYSQVEFNAVTFRNLFF